MVILVTGATGGFGQVLGEFLKKQGETVYGTSRRPEACSEDLGFPLLAMDVLDQQSVENCLQDLVTREGRIDVVINCVNEMFIGSVAETDVDEAMALYNTNVFGVMRVCRSAAKVMKAQGGGTLINMSSLGGLLAVPEMSSYTSAKFALEAYSEAFYHEVANDNISVVIMQPVAMKMDRPETGDHLRLVAGAEPGSASHRMVKQMAADTEASKLTPRAVAEQIYQVLQKEQKPLRVPMDRAKVIGLIKRLAPQGVINKMVRGLVYGN